MKHNRIEYKYFVPVEQYPHLLADLKLFTTPDVHLSPQQVSYPVSSIYFENTKLQTYHTKIDGLAKRYKLRVRSYRGSEKTVQMLEIKYKLYDTCVKERTVVDRSMVDAFLSRIPHTSSDVFKDNTVLEHALRYRHLNQLVPFIQIDYNRQALFGLSDNKIRITIDSDIKCCRYYASSPVRPYIPVFPGAVILEIKTADYFPYWITHLVHKYGLKRSTISKYVLSVQRVAMNSSLCVY